MSAELTITYVGNEGVCVAAETRAVLIDALFGDGVPAYTTTPRAVVDMVETARPPFDRVTAALATHFHPDHFNAHSTSRFLKHSTASEFVSTSQACELLEDTPAFDTIAHRIHAVSPGEGERETVSVDGVRIDAFGLSHGKVNYGDVEHLGFLVYVGGLSVLHLGDGMIAERSLRSAGVLDEDIDVAFLPFWFLTYPFGRRLLSGGLAPRHVFAIHIPPAHERRLVAEVAAFAPEAVPLVDPMSRHHVTSN